MTARRPRPLPRWIALLGTRSRCEREVTRGCRDLGLSAYSPRYLERDLTEHPLYPNYAFVWVADDCELARARRVDGVVEVVRAAGGLPARVPSWIIDELRASETPMGYVRLRPLPRAGERVRLISDASGALGLVTGYDHVGRVRILISMLGRDVELAVRERELTAA